MRHSASSKSTSQPFQQRASCFLWSNTEMRTICLWTKHNSLRLWWLAPSTSAWSKHLMFRKKHFTLNYREILKIKSVKGKKPGKHQNRSVHNGVGSRLAVLVYCQYFNGVYLYYGHVRFLVHCKSFKWYKVKLANTIVVKFNVN